MIAERSRMFDAIVIGGGFYGCGLAVFLKEAGLNVVVLEAGKDLMQRASYVNQARIHNGYHYPRSFITAWRSLINFPRFVADFRDCVDNSFQKIYAIARRGSKVNAFQFRKFCENIGAPHQPSPPEITDLFNLDLIEAVYTVQEFAFNAEILKQIMQTKLNKLDIPVQYETTAHQILQCDDENLELILDDGSVIRSRAVFNATYAQINCLLHQSDLPLIPLKHEITELALVKPPPAIKNLGITVMDGPFFSCMPFPAAGLHSLTHVRYTPHESWVDAVDGYRDPYGYLNSANPQSKVAFMLKDSIRYLPALSEARYERSLYEVKTVLLKNEDDDGRPILSREHYGLKNLYLIMGGKIDNIFDVLQYLRNFTTVLKSQSRGIRT